MKTTGKAQGVKPEFREKTVHLIAKAESGKPGTEQRTASPEPSLVEAFIETVVKTSFCSGCYGPVFHGLEPAKEAN